MSHGVTDWQESGIWPLQDHEPDVPSGMRQQMVGCRVVRLQDPEQNPSSADGGALLEYALGSLGDVHPWLLWPSIDREKRATGKASSGQRAGCP